MTDQPNTATPPPAPAPRAPGWYDRSDGHQRYWTGSEWGERRMHPDRIQHEQLQLLYNIDASLRRIKFAVTLWLILTILALLPAALLVLGLIGAGGAALGQ